MFAAELLIAGYAVSRLAAGARASGGDQGEAWRVARVVGLVRLPDAVHVSAADGLVAVPLAGWVWLTHGLVRHTSALAAVREAAMVVACVVLLSVWLIVWQLGLGWFARAAAVLVVGVPPVAATLLAGRVSGAPMAAAALCLAVLALNRRPAPVSKAFAAIAAVVAALLAPAVTPALLIGLAVLLLTTYDGHARLRLAAAELAVGCAELLLLWVILGGGSLRLTGAPETAVPALSRMEWLLAAGVAVVAVRAITVPAARVWAYVLGTLAVTGVVDGAARAELLTVAMPVAAVLVVVTLESALGQQVPQHQRATAPFWVAAEPDPTTAVLIAGCLGLTMATGLSPVDPAPIPPSDVRGVAGWLRTEPASTPSVLVSDALWPDLLAAGVPVEWLRTDSGLGRAARPQWVVTAAGSATTVRLDSAPVATFGYGPSRVLLYRLGGGLPTDPRPGAAAQRITAGRALTHNPQVRLSATARRALREGDVDLRLVLVLAELAAQHGLTISGFPVVTGEKPGTPPMRRVLVSWIDGQPAGQQGAADLVLAWLGNQQPPYRPRAAGVSKTGLLIQYPYAPPG